MFDKIFSIGYSPNVKSRSHRLAVRTLASHARNGGSIPPGITIKNIRQAFIFNKILLFLF